MINGDGCPTASSANPGMSLSQDGGDARARWSCNNLWDRPYRGGDTTDNSSVPNQRIAPLGAGVPTNEKRMKEGATVKKLRTCVLLN